MIDQHKLCEKSRRYKILFVEDFAPLREKVAEILENYFDTVIVAGDGQEGLDIYRSYEQEQGRPVDIVLTDISMPRKDGLELCRDIKALHPGQIIVILSAHKEINQLIEFIHIGITHYLLKPIQPANLLEMIDNVVQALLQQEKDTGETESLEVVLGDGFAWDSKHSQLYHNDMNIVLTQYEQVLMELLVKRINVVCTVEEIVNEYYNRNIDVEMSNIRGIVYRLRHKLPGECLSSLYGIGYKLTPAPS